MAEVIENCFWTEEKEVNLITLWSEKPCLFDVTSSSYINRLKKDAAFQEIHVFDHIFLIIVPFFRTLPGALWLQNFFRFAVAILLGYIGSRNF